MNYPINVLKILSDLIQTVQMYIITLRRAFMQHFSESIWVSSSDVGGWPLCIVGNDLGIICHKHHPHLLVYRSHYRYFIYFFIE